jgi:hypothetical protein
MLVLGIPFKFKADVGCGVVLWFDDHRLLPIQLERQVSDMSVLLKIGQSERWPSMIKLAFFKVMSPDGFSAEWLHGSI